MREILFCCSLLVACAISFPQNFPCEKEGSEWLRTLWGTWEVEAKDRTSPGSYEQNQGTSIISFAIDGCVLHEVYDGKFKNRDYAVNIAYVLTDALELQKSWVDSEHANLMVLSGEIKSNKSKVHWYRDETQKMQVKHELRVLSEDQLEFLSYLSTDGGTTWQLTHEWKYNRKIKSNLNR